MGNAILINTRLQPGAGEEGKANRFNGFPAAGKPLKRLGSFASFSTRLKPGVNDTGIHCSADFPVALLKPSETRVCCNPISLSANEVGGEGRGEVAFWMGCPSPWPSPRASLRGEGNTTFDTERCFLQSNFPVCCVAGFQTCAAVNYFTSADLEIGDTAGLSRKAGCATALAKSRKDK